MDTFWGWATRGPISRYWPYWPASFSDNGIDDAIRWGSGPYVYVFRGSKYIRIYTISADGLSDRVDPGYPRRIGRDWNFPKLAPEPDWLEPALHVMMR